ncbi:hypothetical protein BU17DRAFT_91435 [Hysterangium stoloniferum]|nr:hypothetical protein BU17DRAFT_91435 [Hysterangium stoloniferum]
MLTLLENDTITVNRAFVTRNKEQSQDDLHLLAVSAQITEVTFSVSDIQTRIFEIQELRHQTSVTLQPRDVSSQAATSESSSIIDQALINLDERLEAVSRSVDAIEKSLAPLLRSVKTPTQNHSENVGEADKVILRKHAALIQDWEAIQTEAEVLREELKEDKWLTVFRSVSEQADGMMKSLEKAVTQCQDFIWQVNKRRQFDHPQTPTANYLPTDVAPINLEAYTNIRNAFESKKKYYMPSVTKILSVVDKGVRDRVTKNGECLRLHAEMRGRWHNLRERISRMDTEMEAVRRMIANQEVERTETESAVSRGTSRTSNGFLDTPSPPRSRAHSNSSTLSRSISPFRKFAARLTAPGRSTPSSRMVRLPSTEPVPSLRERASVFFRSGHKANHSISEVPNISNTSRLDPKKQRWNSSTRIDSDTDATIKASPPRRLPVNSAFSSPPSASGRRSVTPSSQASSRPWTPSTSTWSTPSTHMSPPNVSRPSSRAGSSLGGLSNITSPRPRPQTPSHIPAPALLGRSSSRLSDWNDDDMPPTSLMQRALSPSDASTPTALKTPGIPTRSHTPHVSMIPRPRTPSGSHIPVPKLSISRPGSAMSSYSVSSPRAQTPEASIRARAQQMPFYQSTSAGRSRPMLSKGPPSSFRDTSGTATPTTSSRSRTPSRSGVFTPSLEQNPVPVYVPGNMKDPLDVEVARVVNSMVHGFLVERIDPPLRKSPKQGEEIKAQYAFSNALARKVLNCRLVVISRAGPKGGEMRKVMCRVGGGWQDLSMYLLSRAVDAPA